MLKFASQKLLSGLYEPEGVYLNAPFEGEAAIIQAWGANTDFYRQWTYNGVALKGHPGVDFALAPGARVFAVDTGRVIEISVEPGGYERYIKLEHRWGESLYAQIGDIFVDAGQMAVRGTHIAAMRLAPNHPLHFAIRIHPYHRYDGWGGFCDPLPFIDPATLIWPESQSTDLDANDIGSPHPMARERPGMRRP